MTGLYKPFAATLLSLTALLFGTTAQAAPELKVSASEVSVGETIQIDASSGSSMIPVYAKEWNVSSQFSLISAGRTGAKIKAIAAGTGTVSANVNLKDLAVTIKVFAPEPVVAAPVAPLQEVAATPAAPKLSACQQEMVERKREIAQDFNEARYEDARTKLLDMQKAWLNDSRWADALLGAIDKLAPVTASTPAAR